MPPSQLHCCGDQRDVRIRDLIMKQVAHRVYEDHAWPAPAQRLSQFVRHEPEIKALLKGMPWYAPKALREPLRVAVLASGADFRAPANGVPCCVSPFDFREQRHCGYQSNPV